MFLFYSLLLLAPAKKKPFIYLMQARGGEGDRGRIKMGINTERGRVFPPIAVSSS